MDITKPQAVILSLLTHRKGGQYDADLVKISHGALSRSSIRSHLMGLESQDLAGREAQPCAHPTGGKAPARWFITDAGRAMAQAIQTLSPDALVILQQAVSLAKDEQIAGIEPLRARLLALYPTHETAVNAALLRWAAYERSAVEH